MARTTYHSIEDVRARGTVSPKFLRWLDRAPATFGPLACWPWPVLNRGGYSLVSISRSEERPHSRTALAHRVSYLLKVGPIEPGLTLDHLCRTRNCTNPRHLEPCSLVQNKMRSYGDPAAFVASDSYEPTHCIRGHSFEGNTYQKENAKQCLACRRAHSRIATVIVGAAMKAAEMDRAEYTSHYRRSVADAARCLIAHGVDPLDALSAKGIDSATALEYSPALRHLYEGQVAA